MSELQIEQCWEQLDEEGRAALVDFWVAENAIPSREEAQRRARQAVHLLKTTDGAIVGVTTADIVELPLVRERLYYFRCYVGEAYRQQSWATELTVRSCDLLESVTTQSDAPLAKGVFMVLQTPVLSSRLHRMPVWPRSGMRLSGYSRNGQPIRIRWFEGAELEQSAVQ